MNATEIETYYGCIAHANVDEWREHVVWLCANELTEEQFDTLQDTGMMYDFLSWFECDLISTVITTDN